VRVPLIDPVDAVIYRLDIAATWAEDPAGAPTQGYDSVLKEPYVVHQAGVRSVTRVEMSTPVTLPCQVEVQTFERINMYVQGSDDLTNMVFVFHMEDFEDQGLLDGNNQPVIKPGDRIDHLEKDGDTVEVFNKALYIYEIRPASWGFGPTGRDLQLAYTSYRHPTPQG